MNELKDKNLDTTSFAYRDLLSVDRWESFIPTFGSLTVVGALSTEGRYRTQGRQLEFQVRVTAVTSIASVAGTDYLNLPIGANGISGIAVMTNDTTNVAVGLCHIDVTNSRCYLPSQGASGAVFTLWGSYEIGG